MTIESTGLRHSFGMLRVFAAALLLAAATPALADPELSITTIPGLPDGMTEQPGYAHFTSQLTNTGDGTTENVVLWVEVDGIDDSDVSGGLTLEFHEDGTWNTFGWGGASSWQLGRDAWFLGRGENEVVGFPIPAGHDQEIPLRLNWPNGTYSVTTTIESVDESTIHLDQIEGRVVESDPVDLSITTVEGLPSGSTAPVEEGWAHFTSTLTNNGGAVPENIVLWTGVAGIDNDDYDSGLRLQLWDEDDSQWEDYGWGGADAWSIGRDAWFLGRGTGEVVGFPIPEGYSDTVELRVNFPNDSYTFTTTAESLDSADGSGDPGERIYLDHSEGRQIVTDPDEVQVSLAGLSGSYFQGDTESGAELAQFTFVDNGGGNIEQIFNVFLILDDQGDPVDAVVYDQLYAGFATDPADYIRSLSGTSPANVVTPQTVDVDLLFELRPDAPTDSFSALLTSYDVTGVDANEVSLDDALAGDYPVLASDESDSITILAADGQFSGSVTVNGIEGGPQPGEGVTVTAERDSDGYSAQATASGGTYTIGGLPAGSYTVTATQAGFNPATTAATLVSGDDVASDVDLSLTSAVTGGFASTVAGTDVQTLTFESGEALNDVDLTFTRTDGGDPADFHVSLEVYDTEGNAIDYTNVSEGIFTAATLGNLDIGPDFPQTIGGTATAAFLDGATIELGPNADQAATFEYSLIDERYPATGGRINHQSTALSLDIQPVGEIAGTVEVTGIGGPDVAAGGLTVTASQDGSEVATATTDVDGNYLLEGLAGGTYTVEVSHDGFTAGSEDVSLADGTDDATRDFVLDSAVTGGFTVTAGGNSIEGRTFAAGRTIEDVDLSITRTDGGSALDFYVSLSVFDSGGNAIDYINDGLFSPATLTALDGVLGDDDSFTLTGNGTADLLAGAELELGEDADDLDVATLSFRLIDDRYGESGSRVVHVVDDYNATIEAADTLDADLAGFETDYEQGESQAGSEQVTFDYTAGAGDIEQVFNVFTVLEGGSEIPPEDYAAIFASVTFPQGQIRGLSSTDPSVITAPGDLVTNAVEFELAEDAPLGDYEVVITSYDVTGIDPDDVSVDDTGGYRTLDSASQAISLIQGPELELSIDGPTVLPLAEEGFYDVRLHNTGDAATGENVEVQFTIARPGIAETDVVVDYCTDETATSGEDCGAWTPLSLTADNGSLSGRFGPAEGFPVAADYDETTFIRASYVEPGNYTVTDEVVGIDSDEVLATATLDLAVSELAFDIEPGAPDGIATPDEGEGWAYYTATLSNLGDALPENVALWVDVDGIDDQVKVDEDYEIEYWTGDEWQNLGWAGASSFFWNYGRDAWFLGRPDSDPSGEGPHPIPGFEVGAGEDFATPVRVNFANDTWDLTVTVETADQDADPIWLYAQFDEEIVVESDAVELAIDTVPGIPDGSGIPQDAGWAYYTSTLTNTGGDVPENVLLWIAVGGIDDALKDSAGLDIEYWTGTSWTSLGWAGPSSFNYGFIGRDAWFFGRDGSGGIPGFPIPAGTTDIVPLRVNFPDDEYTFTTTVESLDSAEEDAVSGDRIYLERVETRQVTLEVAQLQIAPDPLDFGGVRVGTTDNADLTVSNTGDEFTSLDLTDIGISGDATFSLAGGTCSVGTTLDGGQSCTIEVEFGPDTTGGFTGSVSVSSTAGNGSADMTGEGIQPALEIAPSLQDFGDVAVGSTGGPQTTVLTNTGSDVLSLGSISMPGAAFDESGNTCGTTLAVGASCEVSHTFSPTSTGNFADSVLVISDAPDSPTAFSLVGIGVTDVDLALAGMVSTDPVIAGTNQTYTLEVDNTNAAGDATGVAVAVDLPAGTSVVATTGCDESPGVPICTIGDLAAQAQATISVTVAVPPDLAGDLEFWAMVDGDQDDPDPADNQVTIESMAIQQADLAVSIDAVPPFVPEGEDVTLVILATNAGPSQADGAMVMSNFDEDALGDIAWTCEADDGASCGDASGDGQIDQSVVLPPDGILTYLVDATMVDAGGNEQTTSTVLVDPPDGVTDPAPEAAVDEVTIRSGIFADGFESLD